MITVEYRDFEEMKEFARQILGIGQQGALEGTSVVLPKEMPSATLAPTPAAPQGAPAAPTSAVPQAAPVAVSATLQTSDQPAVPAVATSVPSYTLDDLARAGMALMDSGRQNDLQQLLVKFNVSSLPELEPAQYGSFATMLREMGAPI